MTKRTGLSDGPSWPRANDLTAWNGTFVTVLGHMGTAYTRVCLEWQQEVARFVGARVDQDRQVWESLTDCRDLVDLAKAQQDWTISATKDYFDEAARLTEIASRFGRMTMAPLHEEREPAPRGSRRSKAPE